MTHPRWTPLAALVLGLAVTVSTWAAPPAPVGVETLDWRALDVDNPHRPQDRGWHELATLGATAYARTSADARPAGDYYPQPRAVGEGLELTVPRAFARPGDRWIDALVAIDSEILAGGATNIEARLDEIGGGGASVASLGIVPETRVGWLRADLRRHGLSEARLTVVLSANGEEAGRAEVYLSAQPPDRTLAPGERIAVKLDTPEGVPEDEAAGVTFGVPFPAGALWDADGLRLVSGDGREVPSQAEVTGLWSADGPVKWVRFDALAVPAEGLYVEAASPGPGRVPAQPVRVSERGDGGVTLDTGAARYELAKGPSPISEIWRNGRRVAWAEGARGLYVVDQNGQVGVSSADGQSMEVESAGPVAACVRFEGFYRAADGEPLARHITRVEAFAGQPEARVTHTLILTRDSNEVWFKEIGWELAADPGDAPRAMLAVSREEWDEHLAHPLDDANASAWVFQAEHEVFASGNTRFEAGAASGAGERTMLLEGERMGDWAALVGSEAGLAASVRDAALQHPKEFEVRPDRLTIRLFSNRAGEELDFRAETLVEKWGLPEVYESGRPGVSVSRERVADQESNAIGWAKTHRLRLSPLAAADAASAASRMARLNAEPVFAHTDPWWIYETEAMGPLHPKHPELYPEAEALLDAMIETHNDNRVRGSAFFGFIDFNAGPVFSMRAERGNLIGERRFRATYGIRESMWSMYARSGDRVARALAAGSVRTFMDNMMAHWAGPDKIRGLFVEAPRGSYPWIRPGDMPMYWQGPTELHILAAANLNNGLYDYYLNGYRRSGDVLGQFAEGIQRLWSPEECLGYKRVSQTLKVLLQAYTHTWDPELRLMAEATANLMYDPEADLGMFWGTTDKPWSCSRNLGAAWTLLGTPPYYDMSMRVARYEWARRVGGAVPGGPANPFGNIANFLHRETGDPLVAQGVELWLRQFSGQRVPGPIRSAFLAQGLHLSQDVLARAAEEDRRRVSWAAWVDDEARPASVVLEKNAHETLDLRVRTGGPGPFEGGEWLAALDPAGAWRQVGDRTFARMDVGSTLTPGISGAGASVMARIRFAKEAPAESYAIQPPHRGSQLAMARANERYVPAETAARGGGRYEYDRVKDLGVGRPRLVLHAPEGWKTSPVAPGRVYFNVPEGADGARIRFGEPTPLYTPDGEPFDGGEAQSGWVELPSGAGGMWSFDTLGPSRLVETENLPPLFAFDHIDSYFAPERREALAEAFEDDDEE